MRRTAGIVALVALSTAVAAPAQAGGKPGDGVLQEITATVETPALFDDEAGGDADADDPAPMIVAGLIFGARHAVLSEARRRLLDDQPFADVVEWAHAAYRDAFDLLERGIPAGYGKRRPVPSE